MDLNRILLFVAGLSPLLLLARTLRHPRAHLAWTIAAVVVLGVTVGAWFLRPQAAGYLGGAAWFFLLLVPALGGRRLEHLALEQRFKQADRMASLLRILHPANGVAEQAKLFRALRDLHDDPNRIRAKLGELSLPANDAAGQLAAAYRFALADDWPGFLEWFRGGGFHGPPQDPWLLPFFLRGLGETGATEELVIQFAARTHTLSHSPEAQKLRALCALVLLSFCGREKSVQTLIAKRLRSFPQKTLAFWSAPPGSPRPVLSRPGEDIVRRIENDVATATPTRSAFFPQLTPVVTGLLVANLIMFALQAAVGGWNNPIVLDRLGQLDTSAVVQQREYWRLATMMFLHAGFLHILFNLFGIYLLGPGLERALGSWRFLASYLIAGLGASLGVVLLHWGRLPPQQVVGASGALMGLVGLWAGYLLKHPHAPSARRRLQSIFLIVTVQVLFDFWTPQISMASHLCGLATGLVLGLLLGEKRQKTP